MTLEDLTDHNALIKTVTGTAVINVSLTVVDVTAVTVGTESPMIVLAVFFSKFCLFGHNLNTIISGCRNHSFI